jgi:pyroglutamyl-peptidase
MKLLLTGFEPFGSNTSNPSQKLVESLPEDSIKEINLFKVILPVDQAHAPTVLKTYLNKHKPDAVLCFGLASGRAKISLERVAINLMDFRIPDNAGNTITDQAVVAGGPAAYFSTLPVRSMLAALQAEGIPAELSLSAGAYLCNQVFYTLMHWLMQGNLPVKAGFIHLPALPEEAAQTGKATPSLTLDQDIRAALIMIKGLLPQP